MQKNGVFNMFYFRDTNIDGDMWIYGKAENPAFLVSGDGVRLKYGDVSELETILERYKELEPFILELPKDQDEIDKLFQNTAYSVAWAKAKAEERRR